MSNILKKINVTSQLPQIGSSVYNYGKGLPNIFGQNSQIEFKDDIITLSVTVNRLHNECARYYNLGDETVLNSVTYEDRQLSRKIRDFYTKKIIFWQLSGKNFSSFRKDLTKLLNSSQHNIDRELVKIAYCLPNFYYYDVTLQDLCEIHNFNNKNVSENHRGATFTLTPLIKVLRKRVSVKNWEYWFKILETGNPAKICVPSHNNLLQLWDDVYSSAYNNSENFKIMGHFVVTQRGEFYHYDVSNWSLLK